MLMGEARAESLWRTIDPAVREGLTSTQETAIRDAARKDAWGRHPIDIRLSLPSPFGRFYLTLVGGRERRSAARRVAERRRYPLTGLLNSLVIGSALVLIVLAGVGLYLIAIGS